MIICKTWLYEKQMIINDNKSQLISEALDDNSQRPSTDSITKFCVVKFLALALRKVSSCFCYLTDRLHLNYNGTFLKINDPVSLAEISCIETR